MLAAAVSTGGRAKFLNGPPAELLEELAGEHGSERILELLPSAPVGLGVPRLVEWISDRLGADPELEERLAARPDLEPLAGPGPVLEEPAAPRLRPFTPEPAERAAPETVRSVAASVRARLRGTDPGELEIVEGGR